MAPRFTCDRHRPEQSTLYRLVQQHAASFLAQAEDAAGADLPQFVKDEFDAFLECGILAHGFLRLRRQRRRFGRSPRAQAVAGRGVYLPYRLRPTRQAEGATGAGR